MDPHADFSDASRSTGYRRDEVDAFVERVEAGGVTPADLRNVVFSRPPIGQRGYHEGDVDAYLDLMSSQLSRRTSGQGAQQQRRVLLYRLGGRNPQQPVLAIDVDRHSIRVIDLDSGELIGSNNRAGW